MICWHCKKELENPTGKLAFRATCDFCSSWLHVCKNCKYYKPGLPNDCAVPGTEHVADRASCNFCDEFSLTDSIEKESKSPGDVAKKLFGEDADSVPNQKNFDDLFKE